MSCKCFDTMNESLKSRNLTLSHVVSFPEFEPIKRVLIATERSATGKKTTPCKTVATFCPFCGAKYENPKEAPAPSAPRAASRKK